MEIKLYNPLALGYIHINGQWNPQLQRKTIKKMDFRKYLKDTLKVSINNVKKVIDTFKELGFIKEEGQYFILDNVNGMYITLHADTVRFCVTHFSGLTFKVYCYLKNKYDQHINGNYIDYYKFSYSEIGEIMGYSKGNMNTIRQIKECLILLEEVGLISYNHTPHAVQGWKGTWMELYKVNEVAIAQKESVKEIKQELPQLVQNQDINIDSLKSNIEVWSLAKQLLGDSVQYSDIITSMDVEECKDNLRKKMN